MGKPVLHPRRTICSFGKQRRLLASANETVTFCANKIMCPIWENTGSEQITGLCKRSLSNENIENTYYQ